MNRINYDQTEGLPLDLNILDFGQKANQISQQLGEIIAPLAIVKGCEENGNNISDGLVYINGELLPFKGALKQPVVRIVEVPESRVFENGNSKPVLITRYATFGVGSETSYNWAAFHRLKTLKQLETEKAENEALQQLSQNVNNLTNALSNRISKLEVFARPFSSGGGMVFFNRPIAEIPEGWREVANWRGRIPMHLNPDDPDFNKINKLFGEKTKRLNVDNLPAHTHEFLKPVLTGGYGPRGGPEGYYVNKNEGNGITKSTGSGSEFSIIPPIKIALFIEPII